MNLIPYVDNLSESPSSEGVVEVGDELGTKVTQHLSHSFDVYENY